VLAYIALGLGIGAKKACPDARRVPAALSQLTPRYKPNAADWNDPGWKCVSYKSERATRYQLQGKQGPNDSYDLYARRADGDDIVEYSMHLERKNDRYQRGEVKATRRPNR
jgi:hypothetical protein